MDVSHLLAALDDAIAAAPRGRRAIALELHTRNHVVLGVRGRDLGTTPEGQRVTGFTKRQCETLRETILAAAHEDAAR